MKVRGRSLRWIPVILACLIASALWGCEGSDARKSITGAVKDLAGQQVIDKGDRMKQDIDRAMKDEARRLLKMDEGKTGDSSRNDGGDEGDTASDE